MEPIFEHNNEDLLAVLISKFSMRLDLERNVIEYAYMFVQGSNRGHGCMMMLMKGHYCLIIGKVKVDKNQSVGLMQHYEL